MYVRELDKDLCMENRLPRVDSIGRSKSKKTKEVLRMTRGNVLCLAMLLSEQGINGTHLRHRSAFYFINLIIG